MPKVIKTSSKIPDGSLQRYPPKIPKMSQPPQTKSPYHLPTNPTAGGSGGKKRPVGRPRKVPPPYPPPPPPPPPPVNNPYYQKFFEDYWKKYSQGYAALPGIPLPPPGAPFAKMPTLSAAMPFATTMPLAVAVPPPPAPNAPPATRMPNGLPQEEYLIHKTDRNTFILATPDDPKNLSEKQCYVRTRLAEIFFSDRGDVEKSVRGRRASFAGQIGLRCVFCVPAMASKDRVERAICYPTTVHKFYQTVQDMQHFHFNACPAIPREVRQTYQRLRGNMNNRRPNEDRISPKEYWTKCCTELGLVDHIGDDGSNAGVKLKEDGQHGLVERARLLPDYAKELFMPPKEKEDGGGDDDDDDDGMEEVVEDDGEEEMEKVLADEVKVDEDDNVGGFDELVADLDNNSAAGKEDVSDDDDEEEGGDGGESC